MNLHQYIIGYSDFTTEKMRARRIHLGMLMAMNLVAQIGSGKENEP